MYYSSLLSSPVHEWKCSILEMAEEGFDGKCRTWVRYLLKSGLRIDLQGKK
jgi:hypothetical protein